MTSPTITASAPVTQPATQTMTFDKWFLAGLIVHADPLKAPVTVVLQRANLTNGVWTLMPSGPGAQKSFSLDAWQEAAGMPDVAAALNAVLTAVNTYATAKNLL